MAKSTITREESVQAVFDLKVGHQLSFYDIEVLKRVARMALAAMDSEPNRNPVLAYADSYRDMAKQGVELVPIWGVITDLERNIAPLYRHAQQPAVPEGLRLALSNAGIAAPESDEMLAATQGKYIQQLVSWVRDRKPFQPAQVLKPVGYLFVSDQGVVAYSPTNWGMPDFRLIGQIYGDMNIELQPAQKRAHKWSYGLVHPENCQCIECRSARINGVKP